jgi:hypothetical protein
LLITLSKSCLRVLFKAGVQSQLPHIAVIYVYFLIHFCFGFVYRCLALSDSLGKDGAPRFRALCDHLKATYAHDKNLLWDAFGIAPDITVRQIICLWFQYYLLDIIQPFTSAFPRADIHELLSPNILHQLIKGTFKDHLVTWVIAYIKSSNSAHAARTIIDDIDQRLDDILVLMGIFKDCDTHNR